MDILKFINLLKIAVKYSAIISAVVAGLSLMVSEIEKLKLDAPKK